jgi:hypothetical protein
VKAFTGKGKSRTKENGIRIIADAMRNCQLLELLVINI